MASEVLEADSVTEGSMVLLSQYASMFRSIGLFFIAFVVVYFVGRFFVNRVVEKAYSAKGLDDTIIDLMEKVGGILVGFAALAVALTAAGFPSFLSAFATLGGALALGLGFASQQLISNFVSGIFILKDKPFRKGDWIEWSGESGIVEEIDLRVTRVRTFDNELLTVPNSDLANAVVKNPVAKDKLRQKFTFGISYDDDIGKANKIIIEEAKDHDGIMEEPEPNVRLTELGDSHVGLQARIWIEKPGRSDFVKTRSEYVQSVKERFDEEGIDIPFPNRTLSGSVKMEE